MAAAGRARSSPAASPFLAPQVPGIAAGFAIIWALAWRQQDARGRGDRGARRRDLLRRARPRRCGRSQLVRTPGLQGARPSAPTARQLDASGRATDVLIVSLGSTAGLRTRRRRAGGVAASAPERRWSIAPAAPPREVRTLALTDLAWARAARAAARRGLAEPRAARAIVYSTTTAALLWPRPGRDPLRRAGGGNRPGRHGLWQRPLERRRLAQAPLLLPLSAGALDEPVAARRCRGRAGRRSSRPSRRSAASATSRPSPTPPTRRRRASTACSPHGPPARAATARSWSWPGSTPSEPRRRASRCGRPRSDRRRTSARCCAARGSSSPRPRREDYGIAQLEALADGCVLVTTPAPGPYAALAIARALDPRLVADDLASGAPRRARRPAAPDYADARARRAGALPPRRGRPRGAPSELLPRLLG